METFLIKLYFYLRCFFNICWGESCEMRGRGCWNVSLPRMHIHKSIQYVIDRITLLRSNRINKLLSSSKCESKTISFFYYLFFICTVKSLWNPVILLFCCLWNNNKKYTKIKHVFMTVLHDFYFMNEIVLISSEIKFIVLI